jgi:hypothetical protein
MPKIVFEQQSRHIAMPCAYAFLGTKLSRMWYRAVEMLASQFASNAYVRENRGNSVLGVAFQLA